MSCLYNCLNGVTNMPSRDLNIYCYTSEKIVIILLFLFSQHIFVNFCIASMDPCRDAGPYAFTALFSRGSFGLSTASCCRKIVILCYLTI